MIIDIGSTTFQVKIVTSCYGDRIYGVGLGGVLPEALSKTLSAGHLIPVTLLARTMFSDRTEETNYDGPSIGGVLTLTNNYVVPMPFRRRLSVFVLDTVSWQQFVKIAVTYIKNTIWWNSMAPFFIIDRSPGCTNSRQFLISAWGLKCLNAKVICCDRKNERIVVGYNPFTSEAPAPWQLVEVYEDANLRPFFLFNRKYGEDEAICVELDFAKTKDLGGYAVSVEGLPLGGNLRKPTYEGEGEYQFGRINERILTTVFHAVNATPTFTGLARSGELDADMKKRPQFMFIQWEYSRTTYPHHQTGYIIVSQFRAQKSQPHRLLPVIEIDSLIGLAIVYFITLIFFKLFVQQPLVPALLNIVRITCNVGFRNLIHNNTSRTYLTGLLLLAVAIQGIYQGHQALQLTTRMPPRNVDTMADLAEFGHKKIYGLDRVWHIVKDAGLETRFVGVYDIDDCIRPVKRDASAACISMASPDLFDHAQASGLHVSSEFYDSAYVAFEIQSDWPLEQRINVMMARLVEADLLRPWDVRCSSERLVDFQLTDYQRTMLRKSRTFESIDLAQFAWAFVILGIGLACATVTFVAELAIRYKCRVERRRL